MNPQRILLGWTCIALAFVAVALVATGLVDPPGLRDVRGGRDLLTVFGSAVLVPLVLFGVGLWLIKGPRRR
jgi:hypothetical protein